MPLILIAAGILGGAALGRGGVRESKRINGELDAARSADSVNQDSLPKLRRDPDTGTYRPS